MKKKNSAFYCFSPPVMIATFAIEITLMAYTIIRYKMSDMTRLVSATLLLLATFQYAEFHVCEAIGTGAYYSRLGYIAIALLPPVGIHLISKVAKRPNRGLIGTAYASGIAFALSFGLNANAFDSFACVSNYAIFHLSGNVGGLFFLYYYFWLFAGIWLCYKYRDSVKPNARKALTLQAVGYLSFVIPTGVVNMINPQTMYGIPSIMCGFAVLYALNLAFGIAPLMLKLQDKNFRNLLTR